MRLLKQLTKIDYEDLNLLPAGTMWVKVSGGKWKIVADDFYKKVYFMEDLDVHTVYEKYKDCFEVTELVA